MPKSTLPYFLLKLLLFLAVIITADKLLGLCLHKMYFTQRKGVLAQTTYAIDSAKQDILIFGSSKAYRQYSPSIISKGTNLSCYNLGQDAQKIAYYTAVEEVALQRNKPSLILLDLLATELIEDDLKNSKLWVLKPYCTAHPTLTKFIAAIGPFESLQLYSNALTYNSFLFLMLNNLLPQKYQQSDVLGYNPYTKTISAKDFSAYLKNKKQFESKSSSVSVSAVKARSVNYLKQFLQLAMRDSIATLVIISPSLISEPELYRKKIREICALYPNVHFVDFSNDPNYAYRYEKFADINHLNKQGAEEFSTAINTLILKNKRVYKLPN